MIILTPAGILLWFNGETELYKTRDFLIFGAALPLIFKSGVSAAASGNTVKLGGKSPGTFRIYFGR
jgi:hypothetical protein